MATAPDAQAPSFRQQASEGSAEKLLYREAYTTYAAQEVVERLAQGFGLQLDCETTTHPAAPIHHGKTVYVYRPTESRKAEGSGQKLEVWGQLAAR